MTDNLRTLIPLTLRTLLYKVKKSSVNLYFLQFLYNLVGGKSYQYLQAASWEAGTWHGTCCTSTLAQRCPQHRWWSVNSRQWWSPRGHDREQWTRTQVCSQGWAPWPAPHHLLHAPTIQLPSCLAVPCCSFPTGTYDTHWTVQDAERNPSMSCPLFFFSKPVQVCMKQTVGAISLT